MGQTDRKYINNIFLMRIIKRAFTALQVVAANNGFLLLQNKYIFVNMYMKEARGWGGICFTTITKYK